jgi:hypothetical protein
VEAPVIRRFAAGVLLVLPVTVFAASPGDVVINEIMYNPSGTDTDHEWIEIFNNTGSAIDLTGWRLREGGTNRNLTFTQGGNNLAAGGYAIIAPNAANILTDYASNANVTGGMVIDTSGFTLTQTGESIALLDNLLVAISSLTYGDSAPWPEGTEGRSIGRVSAGGSDTDPANWANEPANGTPNAANSGGGSGGGGGGTENCSNGTDDDGDGSADCADSDCASSSACVALSTSTAKALSVDDALNPFSPHDRDPSFRQGRILYNVAAGDFVKTVRVADMRGETVRVLVNNDVGPGSSSQAGLTQGVVFWDGLDDSGQVVPMGIYVVFMEAVDPSTGGRVTGRDTIVVGRPF